MKLISKAVALALVLVPSILFAAEAKFSWLPNSESTLAGYAIYYGPDEDHIRDNKFECGLPDTAPDGRVYCTVKDIPTTPLVVAAVAYDQNNLESDLSNIVSLDLPDVSAPADVQVEVQIIIHVTH